MFPSQCRRCVSLSLTGVFLAILALPAAGADLSIDRSRTKAMLEIVATQVEKNFYDPNLKGLPWKGLIGDARRKIDNAQSTGEMLTAIFAVLDKLDDSHTMFLPPGRVSTPHFGFEAKAYGDQILVYEVNKKGAAAKAGLQPGDRLLTVNGFDAQRSNFDLMMLFFRRLRPASALQLTLQRGTQPMSLRVDAKMEEQAEVTDLTHSFNIWQFIREAESEAEIFHYNMYDGGVGYLQMPSFTGDEGFYYSLVKKLDGARAMVVDLRGNPGGAVDMLSLMIGFFESQPVDVAEMAGRKKTELLKAKPRKSNLAGPMFILVDSQTGSAAEIFARHFQRSGRAVVIGDHSSGRVTAARFYSQLMGQDTVFEYGVQVAVARVLLPGGEDLEKKGVVPDQRCIPTSENLRLNMDPCRNLAFGLARKSLGLPEEVPPDKKNEKPK